MNHNANIDLLGKDAPDLMRAISAEPRERVALAAAVGWHQDEAFVAATGTVSAVRLSPRLLPPRERSAEVAPRRARCGSLAEWQREGGRRCERSSIATLLLCAAFAAPLLKLSGRPSFGFNLHGPSKIGKSTMLLAAASVSGTAHERDLPNWSATDSSVGELCRLYNDDLLPLNEVGLISGSRAQVYERIRQTIFLIAEGREKQRHSASVFATRTRKARFSTIFISTSERPFSDYALRANVDRDAGELARCADINVMQPASESIFDIYPARLPASRRRAWAAQQLGLIRQGCADSHGVALVAFIKYLQEDMRAAKDDIARFCLKFCDSLKEQDLSHVHRYRTDNFALLYAAGRMAIAADILRCRPDRLLRWIRASLLASIGEEHEVEEQIRQNVKRLRAHLRGSRIANGTTRPFTVGPENYDGHLRADKSIVIHAARFRKLFEREPGADRHVLKWLQERELLRLARTRTSANSLDRTITWPNRKVVRSFVISPRFMTIAV